MNNTPTALERGADFAKHFAALSHASTGNTTACVVALPPKMDPIRLVGDEDKHATLLFFGETSSLPDGAHDEMAQTLQMVSEMVEPFSESILSIERLGSDTPPALVAKLTNRYLENVRKIMLVNPKMMGFLGNAQQYPSFTPHVTLAYPDYQGEAALREAVSQLSRIRFDRLALWWGDEQTEFPLMNRFSDSEAAWAEDLVENYLAHYGRRGMKWGQHIFTSGGGGSSKSSKKMGSHPVSEDHANAAAALHKPAHALSNQEMQALITRLNLEKQYSQVVTPAKSTTRSRKAAQFAGKLLLDVGKQELTRVAKASAALQVEAAIRGKQPSGKKFRKDLAARITPGGGKKKK